MDTSTNRNEDPEQVLFDSVNKGKKWGGSGEVKVLWGCNISLNEASVRKSIVY